MTPAEELRAAATKVRETAASVTSDQDRWNRLFRDSRAPHIQAINAWVRLASPALAEPLAVLLDSAVRRYENEVIKYRDLALHDGTPASPGCTLATTPTDGRRCTCFDDALTVARQILGTAS